MKWNDNILEEYSKHINQLYTDSYYLREKGVKPNVLKLIGDTDSKVVLDAGCGDSWLRNHLSSKSSSIFEFDIMPKKESNSVNYSQQDVTNLNFGDCSFDVIVGCLLLIFVEDYEKGLSELSRILKSDGSLVLCITNPYFYRTGEVIPNELSFIVTEDLSRSFSKEIKINGEIGPLNYYYRSMADYISAFSKNNFFIKECFDWFIDIADYYKNCGTANSTILRSGKIPLYTFFKLQKIC